MCLSQKQYLEKLLQKFGVTKDTKPVGTPLGAHFKLSGQQCPKTDEEKMKMDGIPYANLVGGLMYAMVCTHPDITYASGIVCRSMHNHGSEHWNTVKCILRYLHGTRDKGIYFERFDEGIDKFSV